MFKNLSPKEQFLEMCKISSVDIFYHNGRGVYVMIAYNGFGNQVLTMKDVSLFYILCALEHENTADVMDVEYRDDYNHEYGITLLDLIDYCY